MRKLRHSCDASQKQAAKTSYKDTQRALGWLIAQSLAMATLTSDLLENLCPKLSDLLDDVHEEPEWPDREQSEDSWLHSSTEHHPEHGQVLSGTLRAESLEVAVQTGTPQHELPQAATSQQRAAPEAQVHRSPVSCFVSCFRSAAT